MYSLRFEKKDVECKVLAILLALSCEGYGYQNEKTVPCGINFPDNYSRFLKPPTIYMRFGTSQTEGSLKDIDELTMNLRFEPRIILGWTDRQITVNQISDFDDSQESLLLDTECLKKIWSPTLLVSHRSKLSTYSKQIMATRYNLSESKFDKASHTNFILMVEESWDLWCKMDFSSYPVDKQVCYQNSIIMNL